MMRTPRWLVTLLMAALLAMAGAGASGAAAQTTDDNQSMTAIHVHAALLDATDHGDASDGTRESRAGDNVSELPSTGRGSVMTGTDTREIVTQQIVQTVLVLAAVVSIAFGGLVLYARQKDL